MSSSTLDGVIAIKASGTLFFKQAGIQLGKFGGYCVSFLKTSYEKVSAGLQNTRYAAISVIAIALLALQVVSMTDAYISNKIPNKYSSLKIPLCFIVGMPIYFGSTIGYAKLLSLPLSNSMMAILTLGPLVAKQIYEGVKEV